MYLLNERFFNQAIRPPGNFFCCCLGVAQRAQLLMNSACLVHLTGMRLSLSSAIVDKMHRLEGDVIILVRESTSSVDVAHLSRHV